MASIHQLLSDQFYKWELRGRGWQVFPEPVHPEPPFVPFNGHYLPAGPIVDDGLTPSFFGSLFRKVIPKPPAPPPPEPEEEPEPRPLIRDELVELQISLPADLDIARESFEQFLRHLASCREPIAFELVGIAGRVIVQFAMGEPDAPKVQRQLQAYFPDAVFQPRESGLEEMWDACAGDETLAVEFGLEKEFMLPLESGKVDPFIGMVGALAHLQVSDLGLFQVLFQPVQNEWAESVVNSVTDADGKPFFVNKPELAGAAEKKVARPLYAAVVRIAVKSETFERALDIASDLAVSLRVFANPHGNSLIPLRNDDYPADEHIVDVLCRQSRRSGMLLNCDELIGFVHLPSSAVRSPALERDSGKTKAAPAIVRNAAGLLLGTNVHFDKAITVKLSSDQRVYHTHIIGSTGTGKSTLLFNLIRQDIKNGEGVALLDPHGDLVDKILGIIPPERIKDVILVDPSDEEFSIGFNILSVHSDLEKTLLASDLVSVFQRLSTSWGDQMQSVLQNAILAFLNSSRGGTLADLRRFLVEKDFRAEFLKSVTSPNVRYYWEKGFTHLSGNKSVGPILTRLEMFLAQPPIALMVSQPENKLNFGEIMDTGKIFLAKLPEGLLGRENSYLLGALLVSKFQQLVMARQAKKVAARRDFWIYIDEFANFITPTMAEILSGARKYRIGLTLAHHELHQLERNSEVASAVMTHPYTRIVFRVGDADAKKLADGFSFFEADDLKNLETGHAICKAERSSYDFNLSVSLPETMDEEATLKRQQEVIAASRATYGTPRAEVETMLHQAWEVESPQPKAAKTKRPTNPTSASPAPPVVEPKPAVAENRSVTGSEKESSAEIPKATEIPKAVGSPAKERTEPPEDQSVGVSHELGRGGARHKTIQERLKKEAEHLGFQAEVEKQLAKGSNQAADLLLRQGGLTIAVEITVTTGVDHEFDNVKKCLASGVGRVAVISTNPRQLEDIAAAVQGGLGSEAAAKVSYHSPDDFIAELRKLAAEIKARPAPAMPPGEVKSHGRTVRRHLPKLSPEEQKQRADATQRILDSAVRPPKL
jgi:hypothetical protein